MLDLPQIQQKIAQRYPFFMLDKVLEIEPMKRAVGKKNITANDFFVYKRGETKIFPSVFILEAMAQLTAVAGRAGCDFNNNIAAFAGMNKVRFYRDVVPGDQLIIKIKFMKARGVIFIVHGEAFCGDDKVAEGELIFVAKDG